jgi:hypothetical protein
LAVLLLGILLPVTKGAPSSAPLEFKQKRGLGEYDFQRCMGIVDRLGLANFDIGDAARNQELLLALGLFMYTLGHLHRCPHNECCKNQNVVPNLVLCRSAAHSNIASSWESPKASMNIWSCELRSRTILQWFGYDGSF